jgi:AhpD family alkylhydroperoxidase
MNRIYLLVNIKIMNKEKEFNDYRNRMNERLLGTNDKIIKRIYNLDTNAFLDGQLSKETKELVGLTCSLVLRCDDCVKYHLGKCYELKFKTEEVVEAMSVATLIGGTIVIPHLRKAVEYWDELNNHV